jgi:hypothetical protein
MHISTAVGNFTHYWLVFQVQRVMYLSYVLMTFFVLFEYDYYKYLKPSYFVNAIITTSPNLMHISLASHTRQEEWEQKSWCWRFSSSGGCHWFHQVLHVSYFSLPWSPPISYAKTSFGFSALIFNDFTLSFFFTWVFPFAGTSMLLT